MSYEHHGFNLFNSFQYNAHDDDQGCTAKRNIDAEYSGKDDRNKSDDQ